METAELFCIGDDQAVRLPPEFWFVGDRVHVRRLGNAVILAPSDEPWRALRDGLDMFTADFMADRSQGQDEVRELACTPSCEERGQQPMTRPWLPPPDIAVPAALAAAVGGHPLVAQTLARRGVTTPAAAVAFLDPAAYIPTPSDALPGMARAVSRLWRAIRGGEPICVWGDFDVDGQTATALLVATLADLGAVVSYHVPVRETESHGVNLPVLKQVVAAGARLILTCDTGVTAHEAVSYARGQGVDVVVTDHHELGASLPDATAVINPKLLPSREHPLADLPGVGVAYKLAEALYERARRPGTRPGASTWSRWASWRTWRSSAATPATCSSAGWLRSGVPSGRAWLR